MKHKLIKVLSLMMALTMLMGSLVLTVGATDCAHETMDVVSEVAATCTTYGYTVKKCADCGYQVTTPTEKVEHEYATVPAVAPTCSVAGNVEYQGCVHCGKPETGTKNDYADPATGNHDWELFVDEPGTGFVAKDEDGNDYYNTTDGRLYKRCTMCAREEVIEVFEQPYWGNSEHNFVFTITQEPTCITNGYATYSCAHCNQKWENIYVAPNATYGHSFTKDLTLNSTCKGENAKNYTVKVCAYCDMPEETLPTTLDCNWVRLTANDAWTLANNLVFQKAKTCTEDGYVVYKCTNAKCGEYKVYVAESDDADQELYRLYGKHEGHKKSGRPTLGTGNDVYCSYYTCSVCSEVFPVDTTHNWATDTAANRTSGEYSVTGTVGEGAGAITLGEPTCYNQGKAKVGCLDCNAYKVITLAPLGHKMDAYKCPACTEAGKACTDCTHANRTVECSRTNCDEENKAVTALTTATAHDIAGGTDVVVRPTCLSKGYTTRVCGNAGCTSNVKVEGSETAKDPNYHENFSIKQGTFTWGLTTSAKYRCDNPTFEWICACTGTEKTLDIYADYDFLVDNLKNTATLAEFKAKVTDAAEFFADTNKTTLKAKDTFKGKGHEEHTTFKPKTDNKDNRLGALAWIVEQSFYGAAIETNILTVDNVYYTDVKAGTTSVGRNVGLTATTATCSDFGNTEGKICVRCGETTVKPTGIAKNTSNHLTQAGALRQNVTLVSYRPATCTIAELVKYDCVCGAKNVEWLGTTDNTVNGHFTYTFNTGYNVEGVEGADLAAKIATIKASYITKSFGDRVFTAYKAADCFTAGNHANLMCEICEKTYAITPVKNAIANNDKTGFTTPATSESDATPVAAVYCDVFGCTCKKAKSTNDGADYKSTAAELATIAVVIPALNHYGFAEKSAFNETIKDAANGWRQVAKQAETCFADGYNAFKVCKICESKTNAADTANNIAEGVNYNNKYVNQLYADNKIVAHGSANWTYTAAKAPTCTQDGVTQNQYCSKCQKYYLNATATTTPIQVNYEGNPNPDKIANITVATTAKINRLGHTMLDLKNYVLTNGVWTETSATPATDCITSSFKATMCVNPACDAFNAFVDFDKDGHADITTNGMTNEVSFYLNNYYAADGHVYAENDLPANYDFTKAPTSTGVVTYTVTENGTPTTKRSNVWFEWTSSNPCERVGKFYVKCTATGCTATHVVATIAAVGHKDWQGNALAVNCVNAGKACTVQGCGTVIAATCVNKVKVVVKAATCEEDGITLYACTLCGKEYGANGTTPLKDLSEADYNAATKTDKLNHSIVTVFTESYVEPTLQNEGSIKILCANCGEVVCKLDKLTDNDIYYTVVPYNPEVGVLPIGTTVPQGGMFKITLMMNSGMVYNTMTLDIELPEGLELVDYEFKLESDPLLAVKNSLASLDEAYANNIRIMSTVTGSDKANVVIDGERVVFAELYVKALATVDYNFAEAFDDSEISGLKVDEAGNQSAIASAEFVKDYSYIIVASKLFDASNNNVVDQGDMIAIVGDLVAGVLGEEVTYNAAADIDRDGKITINDLQYLEKYLLTNQTFADYINVYLMAMSAGKVTLADKIAATDISAYDVDGDGKFGTIADAKKFAEIINEVLVEAAGFNYSLVGVEYLVDNFGALYESLTRR